MPKLVIYLDLIGPLLALPFYLSHLKSNGKNHLLLICFLLLQLFANGYGKILMHQQVRNIYVYQVNALLSCIIVTLYLVKELSKISGPSVSVRLKLYAFVSYALLLIFVLFEDTSFFNSLSYTFTGFTICVFCILFYLQSLSNLKEENLIRSTRFWAVTSFFLYYSISFFIFIYYKVFTELSISNFQVLWGIHNIVLFLSCLLLIVASKYR